MPDNPLPLLAYLRGDLVGLEDDTLYAFKKAGGDFNWTRDLSKGMDRELHRTFEQAYDHLKKASKWLQSLSPDAAIARCVENLGLLPFVRALPMAPHMQAISFAYYLSSASGARRDCIGGRL